MEDLTVESLDSYQLDVLREIGNIGAGNAATALAKLLNKKIDMKVPKIRIMAYTDLSDIMGDPEKIIIGIMLGIQGDVTGSMMFTLDMQAAKMLVNVLMGKSESLETEFSEMDLSALKEIGNILSGSYLSALSTLTGLKILPDVPGLAIDMAAAVLSIPAIVQARESDTVLYIENVFTEGTEVIIGDIFLIPDVASYARLLGALGVLIDGEHNQSGNGGL
jgi:chemotaxis protein CheC